MLTLNVKLRVLDPFELVGYFNVDLYAPCSVTSIQDPP